MHVYILEATVYNVSVRVCVSGISKCTRAHCRHFIRPFDTSKDSFLATKKCLVIVHMFEIAVVRFFSDILLKIRTLQT